MNQELQDRLFKKYPKIFIQKDLSPSETCMCYGIDCGDGWYSLIDSLCSKLQQYTRISKIAVEAKQVKSKLGGLRFYTDCDDDYVKGLVAMAREISFIIDEHISIDAIDI